MKLAAAFICGLVFAIGLGFSGMLKPEKVIGFLEFKDPSLLFVMGPAVAIYSSRRGNGGDRKRLSTCRLSRGPRSSASAGA